MFTIILTIQKFDDRIYIKQVLSHILEFINRSPEWPSIIHNRILNLKEVQTNCINQVRKTATQIQKGAIKELLDNINIASPEFLAKTMGLHEVV